ncbi:hypothetical protein Y045_5973 [Burkholderia pseudomallei MSHR2451]|nr:hypothetical protein X992_5914 [Burkholderia pseudomallei MSHR5492]KGS60911.1 hypothetical protein X990_5611 [Burkholderia pseudomallei MSHR4868]KGS88223.1 hypothetical protein X976_5532 [Burkholderia pseudomallei MSHR7500]KGW19544.1 hypothetical protein X882_5938 [Burkholderia pseudomallei MSHR4303]KGW37021.1 hypothetical protein Y045_5973 [Burkholderia pseudomallei MSHR2451]KGW44115.1 hypothetical protein Y597_6139 [Burkholderia pseudomallei MSHR1000]
MTATGTAAGRSAPQRLAQTPCSAMISRTVSSHLPQQVATPSSNWSSSNVFTPSARDARIFRSETDLHTQTIMMERDS